MAMASTRTTHFAEQHVRRIVGDNLCNLLQYCSHADSQMRVCVDAHFIVGKYAKGSLPFVQEVVAETMQDLMEDLLASAEISEAIACLLKLCCGQLTLVLPSLGKRQRKAWVSALVSLLFLPHFIPDRSLILDDLKLLWEADDDPTRTYREAAQQMMSLAQSTTCGDLQGKLLELRLS